MRERDAPPVTHGDYDYHDRYVLLSRVPLQDMWRLVESLYERIENLESQIQVINDQIGDT